MTNDSSRSSRRHASVRRYAVGKVIAGVPAGDVREDLVEEAIAGALHIDVTIDRIAMREHLEARGVARPEAWRLSLEVRFVEDSVTLSTLDETMTR